MCEGDSRQAGALDEIEITPEMVEAGDQLVINVAELRAVLEDELAKLFSGLGYDQGPRQYEVDYIVGGIVQRGTPRR